MKNAYELAENILKSKPDKNIELKSSDSFASIELYGTSACKKVQDTEFCECFHLENESGTGMITLYHVFPGIDLVYNDMHMEYCNKEQKPASSVMEINYCMEGRCECVFEQNEYGYASVKKNGMWGCVNQKGKVVITPAYQLENNSIIEFIGKWHLGEDLNLNYYTDK